MVLCTSILKHTSAQVVHKSLTITSRSIMKFCANLSFMFTEMPFTERYSLAKDAGFKTVETGFPFGCTIEQVTEAKQQSNVEQILVNLYTGDTSKGELGVTCQPGQEEEFRASLRTTIDYAKSLKCSLVHVMAGNLNEERTSSHWQTYEANLSYAAKELAKEGITGLIEPINSHTVPKYFMNSYDRAVDIIKRINSPNMRLMMDLFHLQQIKGDLTYNIEELLPLVGHIQIAQVPDRNEPNTPGEIDYKYVLKLLEDKGYKGYVGLEYKPLKGTAEGLKWIEEFGYSL
ncbi:hydroxypyruvate isomerase-like protein Gip [Arctopsyche grandis]|uniref:hydroxypyruvate isomerase-like protein Gip n=1 Tax=Arctopsyche grandis TaxID=121162 RepID=UPI00406D8CB4